MDSIIGPLRLRASDDASGLRLAKHRRRPTLEVVPVFITSVRPPA